MALDQTSDFRCITCGSDNLTVLRKDPKGENHKLKCLSCQFVFDSKNSVAALAAGVIQPSSPEVLANATEPERERLGATETRSTQVPVGGPSTADIPLRPAYVFLSKPRGTVRFCSKRDLRRTAVAWHGQQYDVYELKALKINVKVDIS